MRDARRIERLLALRQVPGLADAELSELATVERNASEQRFPPDAVVARAGIRVPAIHLVLEGRLASDDGMQAWGPKQLFGAFEVMAGRAATAEVRAEVPTRTLRLAARDYLEILEDHHGLLSSVRRLLARRLLMLGARRASRVPDEPDLTKVVVRRATGTPSLVDRMFVLRRCAPFAKGHVHAISALAQASDEVRYRAGQRVVGDGERVEHLVIVLDGALRTPHGVLADGAIGALELLGEVPHAGTVDTLTPVHALRVPAAAVFDVMEDHTDFARAIVARLAGAVLDAQQAEHADLDVN